MTSFGPGFSQSRSSLGPKPNTPSKSNPNSEGQTTFSFPMLKGGEILQCMNELNIPLGERELTEPEKYKPEIRRSLTSLVELCTGITPVDLQSPNHGALLGLNHPDLHEDSIPELAFFRACSKMMRICGIMDFSIQDVVKPSSKRLRRQLSGIINFAKFREERLMMYTELSAEREEIIESLRCVSEENVQLLMQYDTLERAGEEENSMIAVVENECRTTEEDIGKLNKLQAGIRLESGELKKKANDLKESNASIALAILEQQAEEQKLLSQIVQSPEKVKKEMSYAQERLDREKKEAALQENECAIMKTNVNNANKTAKDLTKVLTAFDEVSNEIEKQVSCQNEIKGCKNSIKINIDKKVEAEEKQSDAERGVAKYDEKLKHLRQQGVLKTQSAQNALMESQTTLLQVEKDRREGMTRIQNMENELKHVEKRIEEDEVRTEEEVRTMVDGYKKFEETVLTHQRGVLQAIQN